MKIKFKFWKKDKDDRKFIGFIDTNKIKNDKV